jgi:hypothetical protein
MLAQLRQFEERKKFFCGVRVESNETFCRVSGETACSADFWYLRRETQAAVMSRSAVAVEADGLYLRRSVRRLNVVPTLGNSPSKSWILPLELSNLG